MFRLRRLLLHPLAVLGLLHLYAAWRLLGAFPGRPAVQAGIATFLAASFLLMPLSMTVRRRGRDLLTSSLAWSGFLVMGLFSSLCVLLLLRDLVLLVLQLASSSSPPWWSPYSALLVMALAVTASLVGGVVARKGVRVREVRIPIEGLPAALQGFRIAQISDIHVGATIGREFLAGIVGRVNALQADLIAITGDVVDGTVSQLRSEVAPLRELRCAHGSVLVTGNHEYYSGEPEWTREFRALGIRVLKNQHLIVERGGGRLLIAGVTDTSAHHFDPAQRSDPRAALRHAPEVGARILLAHRPASADDAARAGFDLQLSGHTHGGQFWPWNLFVGFFNPYSAGLARHHSMWVYVNRGTGYWGPPTRLGIPPEITLLTLVAAGAW